MTTDAATAFVERLRSDEAFQQKLAGAASREERREIAREAGYELSEADLPAIKAAFGVQELSDEDLERVAGGVGQETGEATVASATLVSIVAAVIAF